MDELKPDTVSVEKRSPLRSWIRREFIAIVVLLLLVILLLQFALVQTWLSTKVTKYLSEATNTTVTAERLKISPFDGVILPNFDIKDSRDNTIVHGGALNFSLSKNIFFLLNNRLDLSYIGVKDIRLNIITELGENKSNIQKFLDNLTTSFECVLDRCLEDLRTAADQENVLNGGDIPDVFLERATASRVTCSITGLNRCIA